MVDKDPNSYRTTVEATRKLAGYQAISMGEAFRVLIDGKGDPDIMPARVRESLGAVLRDFGYTERLVVLEDGDEAELMWVRNPWPVDQRILRGAREIEAFAPF